MMQRGRVDTLFEMETTNQKCINPHLHLPIMCWAPLEHTRTVLDLSRLIIFRKSTYSYLHCIRKQKKHKNRYGVPSKLLLRFINFIASRGIAYQTEKKNLTPVQASLGIPSRTRDCSCTLQVDSSEALFLIESIPENSVFSFENIAMIADNLQNYFLIVSCNIATVYKNSFISPAIKFSRKRKFNKVNFLAEQKHKSNIFLYKDEHAILYVITPDYISGESKRAGFDNVCCVMFDTEKNDFIKHDFSYSNSSNNSSRKCESTTKATTVRIRKHSNSDKEYLICHKRYRRSFCLPRPISLHAVKTTAYNENGYVTAPLSGTSYSNPSFTEPLIAQTSDAVAYTDGISYPSFHSEQRTSELSFYEPRKPNGSYQNRSFRDNNHTAYKRYTHSEARKTSFTERWPHPETLQSIENMVQYGFFFTGTEDLVRCFECGIGLKDWGRADDPVTEHVRYSPDCQYLVDVIPPTKLKEIKASFLPNHVVSMRESMVSGATGQTTSAGDGATNSNICLPLKPRNPQYIEIAIRISSFSKWPRDITQTPEELAEAGFFYTGCNDIVRCFVCDGGLQKWSPGDSAWVEHARWFPRCAYVRQKKGDDFVELVRLSAEYDQLEEEGPSDGASGYSTAVSDDVTCRVNHLNISEKEPQSTEELVEENEKLRSLIKCHQCQVNDVNCLFLPCAHLYYCFVCSAKMKKCPKCKTKIKNKVKTFMS